MLLSILAQRIKAQWTGDIDVEVLDMATLSSASTQSIGFFNNTALKNSLKQTQAAAVILHPQHQTLSPVPCLLMDDPYLGYARCMQLFHPRPVSDSQIHPSAIISEQAQLGNNVSIGAYAVLGAVSIADDVIIGANCILNDGVVIGEKSHLIQAVSVLNDVKIGQRAIIHAGAVIGADGFAFANDAGQWIKIPQIGSVNIGDDVEIGSNTTIDRGALEDTVIEDGVKLDNQIQIAHNVHIGKHTAIAACVGIAGSTHIGAYCAIGGGVGMVGHIKIADKVQITGGSVVLQSILHSGTYSSGSPLQHSSAWRRNYNRMKQLDTLAKKIKKTSTKI